MPGNQYLRAIRETIGARERVEDVVKLIDLLSDERQETLGERVDTSDEFAATILCILFAPVKTDGYRAAVSSVRSQFAGVSKRRALQHAFVKSMTEELLTARSAEEAIRLGVHRLFRLARPAPPENASGPMVAG